MPIEPQTPETPPEGTVDLAKIERDLAAWTAQGDTGPLTRSPGFRALLRTAVWLAAEVRRLRAFLARGVGTLYCPACEADLEVSSHREDCEIRGYEE